MSFLTINWKDGKITEKNPIGLNGVDFLEYSGPDALALEKLFIQMGFIELAKVAHKNIKLFRQGDINFILNCEPHTFAMKFAEQHGPCVSATGFRVGNASEAFEAAVARGAKVYDGNEASRGASPFLAIYGIGDSLIYFIDEKNHKEMYERHFGLKDNSVRPMGLGFQTVDHFTNNVPKGDMHKWFKFYESVFNFHEIKYFDIKGKSTGLLSQALGSPCGKFAIPINEPSDSKSQIQEYLDEYKGSGIQHIAMTTENIIPTIDQLKSNQVQFLAAPPTTYYTMLKDRLPMVTEDLSRLEKNAILVDGDHEGYLLQIFTKNVIGPVFFEVIQRKGHDGFGNGNFQALFDAIEADQRARGYL